MAPGHRAGGATASTGVPPRSRVGNPTACRGYAAGVDEAVDRNAVNGNAVNDNAMNDNAVEEFVATLREAKVTLGRAGARIAAARVDDDAFGKVFEAGEVRAAYHTRLPAIELDIATAEEVLGHFITGLT